MKLIFDAHLDLAMNALEWNRDLRLPINKINDLEKNLLLNLPFNKLKLNKTDFIWKN